MAVLSENLSLIHIFRNIDGLVELSIVLKSCNRVDGILNAGAALTVKDRNSDAHHQAQVLISFGLLSH